MPRRAWTDERERHYEHIKKNERQKGTPIKRAEEMAARTGQSGYVEQALHE